MRTQINTFEAEREWVDSHDFPVRPRLCNAGAAFKSVLPPLPTTDEKMAQGGASHNSSALVITYDVWRSISASIATNRLDSKTGSHKPATINVNRPPKKSDKGLVFLKRQGSTAEPLDRATASESRSDNSSAISTSFLGKVASNQENQVVVR